MGRMARKEYPMNNKVNMLYKRGGKYALLAIWHTLQGKHIDKAKHPER